MVRVVPTIRFRFGNCLVALKFTYINTNNRNTRLPLIENSPFWHVKHSTHQEGTRVTQFPKAWTVREITKSSTTFSATNISSNMICFFQLHDTIKRISNQTGINYNHNDIAIRSHIMIYNSVQNSIFATKFSTIYLARKQKRLVFQLSFVNLQRAKDGTHMFDAKYRYVFVVYISSNRMVGITPY